MGCHSVGVADNGLNIRTLLTIEKALIILYTKYLLKQVLGFLTLEYPKIPEKSYMITHRSLERLLADSEGRMFMAGTFFRKQYFVLSRTQWSTWNFAQLTRDWATFE